MTKQQRQQRQQQQQQQQQQQTLPQWQQPHVGAGAVRAPSPVYDLQEGVYYRSGGALSGMAGAGAAAGSSAVAYAQQQQVNEVGEVVVPLPATAEEVEDRQRERARRKREKAAAAEEEAREAAWRARRATQYTRRTFVSFFVSPSFPFCTSFIRSVFEVCLFWRRGAFFVFVLVSSSRAQIDLTRSFPIACGVASFLFRLSLSRSRTRIFILIGSSCKHRSAEARKHGAVPGDGAARAVSRQRYRRARPPRVACSALPTAPTIPSELRHAQRGRAPVRPALRRHDGHRGDPAGVNTAVKWRRQRRWEATAEGEAGSRGGGGGEGSAFYDDGSTVMSRTRLVVVVLVVVVVAGERVVGDGRAVGGECAADGAGEEEDAGKASVCHRGEPGWGGRKLAPGRLVGAHSARSPASIPTNRTTTALASAAVARSSTMAASPQSRAGGGSSGGDDDNEEEGEERAKRAFPLGQRPLAAFLTGPAVRMAAGSRS